MPISNVLALDVGEVRVGLAIASWPNGIATPYKTISNDQSLIQQLTTIIDQENIEFLVIGYPRNLSNQTTAQTDKVVKFAEKLSQDIKIAYYFQDEALTSIKAETELNARHKPYQKADIDSLSATYILEDFINEQPQLSDRR